MHTRQTGLTARTIETFFCVFFLLFAATGVHASAEPSPEQGLEMVREFSVRLFDAIEREDLDSIQDHQRIYKLVDEVVFSKFDFQRISGLILGRDWRGASPTEKTRFVEQFKIYLVRNYAKALAEYKGQKIEYLPIRQNKKTARAIKVQSRMFLTKAAPINIDYVLSADKSGSWKVVDMVVEGISLVLTHRSSFQTQVKRKGISGLIADLEERNEMFATSPAQTR